MKTIIIPDIHNRVDWIESFLSSLEYDNVVFLGDYFDEFKDTRKDAINAAEWLKQSLYKPNRIHLIGTHDIWYMFPKNPFVKASGNSSGKAKAINKILSKEDWELLKLFHYTQLHWITHAGIHPSFADETNIRNKIRIETNKALDDVKNGNSNPWLGAGEARGGYQKFGGIIWLDWNEEFEPIPYINQIVGHTTHIHPVENCTKNSKNYCIDTRNKHIGILENGEFLWQPVKNYK